MSSSAGASTIAPIQRSSMRPRRRHPPRVALDRPCLAERGARIDQRCDDVKGQHALAERALLVLQVGMMRENLLAVEILRPEARRRHDVFAPRRQIGRVRQREERNALVVDLLDRDLLFERPVRDQVPAFVEAKARRAAEQDLAELRRARFLLREARGDAATQQRIAARIPSPTRVILATAPVRAASGTAVNSPSPSSASACRT